MLSYLDVVLLGKPVGRRVAIVGAGGIGFDVAEFLTQPPPSATTDVARWSHEWGVDETYANRGGLTKPAPEPSDREIYLLQRTPGTPGKRLNKTTGWVHRASLKMKNVKMLGAVSYERIDDAGFHIVVDGKPMMLDVDNVDRLRRPGIAPRSAGRIAGRRHRGAPDRRRRRRRRARRQTRHRAGNTAGRFAVDAARHRGVSLRVMTHAFTSRRSKAASRDFRGSARSQAGIPR